MSTPESSAGGVFTAVTYNIHSAVGRDRRYEPERILEVLAVLAPDIVALQEVDARLDAQRIDQFEYFAERSGMACIAGPNIVEQRGRYGNMLLTRLPIQRARLIELPVEPRQEPRGAICALVNCAGLRLQIVNAHFGLRRMERRAQAATLLQQTADHEGPTVFMGDFNTWRRGSEVLRMLGAPTERDRAPRTFPAGRPLLALDRIWTVPRGLLTKVAAVRTTVAALASDHLPLVATVCLSGISAIGQSRIDYEYQNA